MAFIIEDGTGKEDANSYLAVLDFKDYWADYNVVFTEADPVIQAWLIRATIYADTKYFFLGYKADIKQALEFPRINFYDDTGKLYASNEIPKYLKWGVAELAYYLKDNPTLTPNITSCGVQSKKIGPVQVTYNDSYNSQINPIYGQADSWFQYITTTAYTEVLPI